MNIKKMKRVIKSLEIIHKGLTVKKYDGVFGVFGEEGTGKSSFNLNTIEEWIKLNGREPVVDDVRYINQSLTKWGNSLAECVKYDINVLDEAGRLSNKKVMTKLNQAVNEAYQIIRADNLFSIITLPSLWELDSFFTKRRMRGAWLVYKRGKVAFWDRTRLRKIIAINERRIIKSMWVVKPNYLDTFRDYKGIMLEPYLEKKKEFMKDTRKRLAQTISELEGEKSTKEKSEKLPKSTLAMLGYAEREGFTKAAKQFGIHRDTLYDWKKKRDLADSRTEL